MSAHLLIAENILLAGGIAVLLLFSAFFSASETAFFSLSRARVHELEGHGRRERLVAAILRDPRMFLVTILFGNLLVNIGATSIVTALAIALFGERGVGIAVLIMTGLILMFGEISPKTLAVKSPERFAVRAAPLLRLLMLILGPVRLALGAIADFTVEQSRRILGESREAYHARELATAVEMGHREGLFGDFEREVLTNLFLFSETTAREIVTPRIDVFSLDADTPLIDAIVAIRRRGYSRVPVFEGSADTIVGVLAAKDLLRYRRDARVDLREIMRPPVFVPEGKKIRDLFGELIASHGHVVLVVDEHGSYTGLVTIEDILEEIFGEIRDRREPKVDDFHRLGEDRIVADGAMRLEDVNEIMGTDLDSWEVETIAGWLIDRIGRIPREGESFSIDGLRFLVLSAETTRVNKLTIEREGKEGRS